MHDLESFCREGEWARKRSFFTFWTEIWAGVSFLGACNMKRPGIRTGKIVIAHWSWVRHDQCPVGKIAIIPCLKHPPTHTHIIVFVFKQIFSENIRAELSTYVHFLEGAAQKVTVRLKKKKNFSGQELISDFLILFFFLAKVHSSMVFLGGGFVRVNLQASRLL